MAKELCVLRICKGTFGQVNALKLGFESARNTKAFAYSQNLALSVVYMYNSMASYGLCCCSRCDVLSAHLMENSENVGCETSKLVRNIQREHYWVVVYTRYLALIFIQITGLGCSNIHEFNTG
jgi:hypothetical protein